MAITEAKHAENFLVSEDLSYRSREVVTILSGENLKAGHVLGKVTTALTAPVGAAAAGNTGDGTIGSITAGTGVQLGVYKAVMIEPATDAGTFQVEDPLGVIIGTGTVAVAFTGEVNFTISDGATDFVAGDFFTITVAAGSNKYVEYDPTNNDGSETAVAVLMRATNATAGDKTAIALVRDAQVNASELEWFTGASAGQKTTGQAELALVGIIAR